jgi:hypothetical protein
MAVQKLDGGRRDVAHQMALHGDNAIVTNEIGFCGDVLYPYECGLIAGLAERVHDVLAVIVQRKTTMGKAQHATAMGALPGQQAGSTGRAGRCSAKALPKQDAFLGKPLDVRRWNIVAVGLNVAPRVVGMDIQNVGTFHIVALSPHSRRTGNSSLDQWRVFRSSRTATYA